MNREYLRIEDRLSDLSSKRRPLWRQQRDHRQFYWYEIDRNLEEFSDIVYDGEFINSETKETILWCEYGDIVINNVRTMREDNTLICSALGKKYTMKSLNSSGGKIYAFI